MNIQGLNSYNIQARYANKSPLRKAEPSEIKTPQEPSFKGKESKFGAWISKVYGKYYAEKMYNKKWVQNASEKMSKAPIPGSMTEHMATLGSILTSSVYMWQTVHNKDLDADKRKTLAINQGLCCIIPALAAYTVAAKIRGLNKNLEHLYRGLKEQQITVERKVDSEKAKMIKESLGSKLKNFGSLMGLLTFTLIYRYVTPVLVTPLANKLGDKLNQRKKAKQIAMQPAVNTAKEVEMKPTANNTKQVA